MHEAGYLYEIQISDAKQGAGAIVNNSSTNGLVRFRDLSLTLPANMQ